MSGICIISGRHFSWKRKIEPGQANVESGNLVSAGGSAGWPQEGWLGALGPVKNASVYPHLLSCLPVPRIQSPNVFILFHIVWHPSTCLSPCSSPLPLGATDSSAAALGIGYPGGHPLSPLFIHTRRCSACPFEMHGSTSLPQLRNLAQQEKVLWDL